MVSNDFLSNFGNDISTQVYGFGANPVNNSDPIYDYYIFDVYVAVSSNSANQWYVDSGGLGSSNGPSFNVTISGCASPNEQILFQNIWPTTELDIPSTTPETTSVSVSCAQFSIGVSNTFFPPTSQTKPIDQTSCLVGWASASNVNDKPPQASYQYNFAFGLKVEKGFPAILGITAEGAFYKETSSYGCGVLYLQPCYELDHPVSVFTPSFNHPPISTVTSNPPGLGFVQVQGVSVVTPHEFCWDEGLPISLTASPYKPAGPGTQFKFSNWNGSIMPSVSIVAPSSPQTYLASFYQQNELDISQPTYGTTDPPPGQYWYNSTSQATVEALPNSGFSLNNWILDGSNLGSSNPIAIPMNSPHTLAASFTSEPTLTVSSGVGGTVTVSSNAINNGTPTTISAGSSQTFTVPSGSSVTLAANPEGPYFFGNWTGTQFYKINPVTIAVTSNAQEMANFLLPVATVTFQQSGLPASASGVVLTVDGSTYSISSLPLSFKWVVGSTHNFAWSNEVPGVTGTKYVWQSTAGLTTAETGTITLPANGGSITANWGTQYLATFQIVGLDYSAEGTILTIGATNVAFSQFPFSIWVNAQSSQAFNFTTDVMSNVPGTDFQFVSSSQSSPLTISGSITISASYSRITASSTTASTASTATRPTPGSSASSSTNGAGSGSSSPLDTNTVFLILGSGTLVVVALAIIVFGTRLSRRST